MTRNRIHLLPLLLLLLLLNSCSEETTLTGLAGDGTVSIPYTVDATVAESRAVTAEPHECLLQDAVIIFFDKSNDAMVDFVIPEIKSDNQLRFIMPATLEAGVDYSVLAAGNLSAYLPGNHSSVSSWIEGLLNDGATRESVIHSMAACSESQIVKNNPGILPMWGEMINGSGSEIDFNYSVAADEPNYEIAGTFKFYRSVVRIDVQNLVPQQIDLKYVRVWNHRDKGFLFQNGMYAGDIVTLDTKGSNDDGTLPEGYTLIPAAEEGRQTLKAALYAFPNHCSRSIQNDKTTTCLILGGILADDKSTGKITWYRFNICNFDGAQSFMRNHCYRATITGVKERGKDDDKQAYEYSMPTLDFNVDVEWSDDDDNTATDSSGNFILLSRNRVTFAGNTSNNTTSGSDTEGDGTGIIEETVTTVKTESIQVRVNPGNDWEWVSLANTENYGDDDNQYFEVSIDKTEGVIYITPKETNETDRLRYAYYAVRSVKNPNLQVKVYVEQSTVSDVNYTLTANGYADRCYVTMDPNGGTVDLLMRTGSGSVGSWRVTNITEFKNAWDKNLSVTTNGGDYSTLRIKVPAYVYDSSTGDLMRSFTLHVTFHYERISGDQTEAFDSSVDIYLTQRASDDIISIYPDPYADGELDEYGQPVMRINCFQAGPSNWPNGVPDGLNLPFNVSLKNADYYFVVESTFNFWDELFISDRGVPYPSIDKQDKRIICHYNLDIIHYTYYASNKTQFSFTGNANTAQASFCPNYNNVRWLNYKANEGTVYLYPYAMGPGDKPIKGSITITAYHKDDHQAVDKTNLADLTKPSTSRTYNFELYTPDVIIDDVILRDIPKAAGADAERVNCMVSDRYVGAPGRVNNDKSKGVAYNYSNCYQLKVDQYYYGNLTDEESIANEMSRFQTYYVQTANTESIDLSKSKWKEEMLDNFQMYSPFYTDGNISKWDRGDYMIKYILDNKVCYSKWRTYLVSDEMKDGKYVCCWLQQLDMSGKSTATAFTSYSTSTSLRILPIKAASTSQYFYQLTPFYCSGNQSVGYSNLASYNFADRFVRTLSDDEVTKYLKVYPREPGDPYLGAPIGVE